MKPQIAPDLESFYLPVERLRLIKSACQLLQVYAIYLRSLYGEHLLYGLRKLSERPGFRSWFDAYEMAIHRAEQTDNFHQQLLIMDEFYKELLSDAFEIHWLRKHLNTLQKDKTMLMFAIFDRESGEPHLIFPTLTEVNTVQFDERTAQLLDKDFTEEEIRSLIMGLKIRASNAYFTGKLFKGKPLAFENRSRYERRNRAEPEPPPPTSWLTRLLNWFIPSRRQAA